MTVIAVEGRARARTDTDVLRSVRVVRRRRYLTNIGAAILSVVLVIWSLLPIYNMIMVSLDSHSDVLSTHVLATLGIRNAFEIARPDLGMAAVMSALPLMIPLVIFMMRKLRSMAVEQ